MDWSAISGWGVDHDSLIEAERRLPPPPGHDERVESALRYALDMSQRVRSLVGTPSPSRDELDRMEEDLLDAGGGFLRPRRSTPESIALSIFMDVLAPALEEYFAQWPPNEWQWPPSNPNTVAMHAFEVAWTGSRSSELVFEAFIAGRVDMRSMGSTTIEPRPIVPAKTVTRPDGTGRWLHCDDGPAFVDGDGRAVYAVDGVRVPRRVVLDPGSLTMDDVMRCKNQEVRRVMLSRMRSDAFAEAGEVVHEDETGQLWDCGEVDNERLRVVRVVDSSTAEVYWLRVPPETERARQGVAWTFNVEEDSYRPDVET